MANFQYGINIDIILSDGMRYHQQLLNQNGNAKLILDDTFAAGEVLDLTPYLKTITVPAWLLIVADGDGVTLDFDALGSTTKYYKLAFYQASLTLPAPQGAIVASITLAVAPSADQRIQVIALGTI